MRIGYSSIALFLLLLGLCAGCTPTLQQREASLQTLNMKPADQDHLVASMLQSTLLLQRLRGAVVSRTGNQMTFIARDANRGSSVVLSEDGYLLTAAHCVAGEGVTFFITPNGKLLAWNMRTVYMGDEHEALKDLAILKIDVSGLKPFAWADDAEIQTGFSIAAAGGCVMPSKQLITAFAGHVSNPASRHLDADGYRTRMVAFHAPIGRGDSGGPLATPDGRLIGINHAIRIGFLSYYAEALRPDPAWIAQLIENDRLAHPTTRPAARRSPPMIISSRP
jgi:S1-C subfamily serine protease